MLRIFLLCALVTALALPAAAETYLVTDNGTNQTFTVKPGDTVSIMGNENTIRLVGPGSGTVSVMGNENLLHLECPKTGLEISGNENTVAHDASGGSISLLGNENDITLVRKQGRPEPSMSDLGTSNTVTKK